MQNVQSQSFLTYEEKTNFSDDLEVLAPNKLSNTKTNRHYDLLKTNKLDYQMCSWNSKLFPKQIPDKEPLNVKADRITDEVILKFIDYYENLEASKSNVIEMNTLKKLFEVGFNEHACRGTAAIFKELPCLIGDLANNKMSCKAKLQRCIKLDLAAEINTSRTRAFNTTLPPNLRHFHVNNNIYEGWIKINIPKELDTMEAVFNNIEHLRSTKAFYNTLIKEKKILPRYLKRFYELEKRSAPLIRKSSGLHQ